MRLAAAAASAFGAAVIAAIALAVLDIYLTGHGRPSLMRPWIEWPAIGVHLSRAGLVFSIVTAATFVAAWVAQRRD